ncbi:MAG TPA: hypothetical protein DDW54_00145, partial [Clostridiales bacterium]|nr:hypothetical protein [Clostridiales bacterium]
MVGSFGKKRKGAYNPNRVNALDSGVAYIAVLAVFALASFGLQYVPTEFFREIYEYDVYLYLIVNTLFSQFLIFAVALVYSLIRKSNPFSGGGFVAKKDAVHSLSAVILTAGIMMTFYYVHLQFGSDVTTFTGSTDFPFEENLSELAFVYAFLYVILSALLPAVFEEMLFRGIIMRGLEQYGKVFAVVVSSLMFALMHGNFEQLILQFIGGLAIGTVVMLTGNFVLGSLMHFFNNFFAMIFAAMINPLESTAFGIYRATVADAASIVIGIAFLIFGVLYFGS